MRGGLADLQRTLVFLGSVPAPRGISIGKFNDDDPFRLGFALEQINLPAPHNKPPAKSCDAGRGERPVRLVGSRIGYLNVGDHVSGHLLLLFRSKARNLSRALRRWPRSPHAAHPVKPGISRQWPSVTPRTATATRRCPTRQPCPRPTKGCCCAASLPILSIF